MLESKWEWVSNHYGPMGWFTDAEKTQHEGSSEFSDGHWRSVSDKEMVQFNATIGRLAYEQA